MRWIKHGRIFAVKGASDWMASHAQVPRALELRDRIRIYFCTRPPKEPSGQFVSRIGFVDVERDDPSSILSISQAPALDLGDDGEFDRFGVMPGCVQELNGELRMYYTGWTRRYDVPFETAIGMAVSENGGATFSRPSPGPTLARTPEESLLCNGPFIVSDETRHHLFYSSAIAWLRDGNRPECHYVIKRATSEDAEFWDRDAQEPIPRLHELECQNAPTVIRLNGRWHMWFCHRHALDFRNAQRGYRLGYAWSDDLQIWHRDDGNCGIELSESGWDSEMMCYPSVYSIDGRVLLFYCGNGFGVEGFGYAELGDIN